MKVVDVREYKGQVHFDLDGVLPVSYRCVKTQNQIQKMLGIHIGLCLGVSVKKRCLNFWANKKHLKTVSRESIKNAINEYLKDVRPE